MTGAAEGARASVSVVIAARGPSSHLGTAVRSALAQPEAEEVLVALDPRGAGADLALPSDPRLRVVRAAAGGPAAVRNAGLDESARPYVAFLDDDDAWLPGHLAAACAALARHPRAVLVAMNAYLFDDPSKDGASPFPRDAAGLPRFSRSRREGPVPLRSLLLENPLLTPATVVRRGLLLPDDRFDPDLPVMEDWDLWLRIARRGEVILAPEATVLVRRRSGSASRDLEAMAGSALRVLERQDASGMLRSNLSESEVRRRVGRLWHDLAYARMLRADGPGTRIALRESVRRLPGLPKNYIYWLASYLPAGWLRRT